MQRILAIVGALAVMPLACGDGAWDLKTTGRPIVYGSLDTNPAHMATVALTQGPNGSFFCSGTLITDTVVLTAGHCLQGSSGNPYVFFGDDVRRNGEYRATVEGEVHPDYNGQSIRNDIALLRLASPAPTDIESIPYLPAELGLSAADQGVTTVDFSGFGRDENNNSGVKLHVVDTIDVVCDGPGSCAGYVNPLMFGYDQQPGGPCSGDSGGPSYILRGGVEYVAGVTSYGDQDCAQYGASTTADRFAEWIDAFIAPEICGNGVDDDGDGRVDCADRECGTDATCPDTCETAQTIRCSDQVHSTTAGGAWAFTEYGCLRDGIESGPEVAFLVDAPVGTHVTADLVPGTGGDLDFFLVPASGDSCDPQACLDGSTDYNTAEQIVFDVPAGGVYLVVETWDKPTGFDLRITCGVPEECANGVDDDYDGRVDCSDPDCGDDPACQIPDEDCTNGLDDDQDGDADCDDADCAEVPACVPPPPENCNNGLDDDQDGAMDCDDSDCTLEVICQDDSGGGGGCAVTGAAGPGSLAFLMLGLLLSLRFRRR